MIEEQIVTRLTTDNEVVAKERTTFVHLLQITRTVI